MHSKTILIGNVGKDPEMKHFENSTLAKFSIATSESYKNKHGETIKTTQWHNISAWGKLAEIIERYVKKGALLYVEGVIQYSSTGKGDQKKYYTDIKIDQMKMLGGKKEESISYGTERDPSNTEPMYNAPTYTPAPTASDENGTPDSQLPF